MSRLEAGGLLAGAGCVVVALVAVDWRLGLLVAGVFVMLSTLDIRGRR